MKNTIYLFRHTGDDPSSGWQLSGIFGHRVPSQVVRHLLGEEPTAQVPPTVPTIDIPYEELSSKTDPTGFDYYMDTYG